MKTPYAHTADVLTQRIVDLGTVVLDIDDPWQLFNIPGFNCKDLEPSLYQAGYALRAAQQKLRNQRHE